MKAAVLLLLVIIAMRLGSWMIGWAMVRVFRHRGKVIRVGANALCLAFLVGFLRYDRLPNEAIESSAVVFGIVTFSTFTVIDLWKWPWSAKPTQTPETDVFQKP
jgi:hypothetical protein